MTFITAFCAAVPTKDRGIYLEHITQAATLFKDYGAARVVEGWGADVPDGDVTSFPLAVQCKPDETVVFGFVEWPSRKIHDEGMPKVMEEFDEHMEAGTFLAPPFDGKRMIFGGFEVIHDS